METPNIEQYEVLEQIAEGGIATIWIVRHRSRGRIGILKVYQDLSSEAPAELNHFRSQILAAGVLDHPNITAIYDAGGVDGACYVVTEYAGGDSALELMESRGPFSEKGALDVARRVAGALEYAWAKAQIIHTNVKPNNILFHQSGELKLADLGISRVVALMRMKSGIVRGTPNYMPPEQFHAEARLDQRVDIYALGATLYHLLTEE